MTGRAAAIQGGLAALGLLAANMTWQRPPEHAPGSVTVLDASKSDVNRVHYEDDRTDVDFSRGQGDKGPPVWIHLAPKAKVATPAKPGAKPTVTPPPPRDLAGPEQALRILDQFGPLVSPRGFGVLDANKLKELGLDAPKRHLDVTVKGEVHHFSIGEPAKTTAGESFLRDMGDGRVFLMPRGLLADLQNPEHMVDRRLHTFDRRDFDRMVLAAGGKSKAYVQLDRESPIKSAFAPAKTPDKPEQMAKNWYEAVSRAFPSEVLGRGEEPPGGKPAVVLRVDYYDGKTTVGFLELARQQSTGAVSEEAPAGDVYARTEHSVGWLKLHNGAQLVADAQKLIAAH